MKHTVFVDFGFEAAHMLPGLPEGHKCSRLHGHSYKVRVYVAGELDRNGFVVDFGDIKKAARPVFDQLDHNFLNQIPGLENPTSEVLSRWIFLRISQVIPGLRKVVIRETCTSGAIFTG